MPAMSRDIASRQMVLVFTDLVDSVAWKRDLGNAGYIEHIQRPHDEIFKQIFADMSGAEVLKDTGDGYMVRFPTSSSAVSACLRFQWEMFKRNWGIKPAQVRVGVHAGEISEVEKEATGSTEVVGIAADMAARVMGLAVPGQILLTRTVFDDARTYIRQHPAVQGETAPPTLQWLAHGPYLFKGCGEPVDVFEVGADGIAPLRIPADSEKARRAVAAEDEVTLGWRPAVGLSIPTRENWHLIRKLGKGGFGEVWLAEQHTTNEQRVFKFCFQADRLHGLKREVALIRLLKDTLGDRGDIARIIDWQFERPPYFLETEYTPDGVLPDWAERQGGIEAVPMDTKLELIAQVADALAAAHDAKVIHKDIKPSNILIRTDATGLPRAVLADFGIGLVIDRELLKAEGVIATGFTQPASSGRELSPSGTWLYTAPELFDKKEPSKRSDIYSLGVVLLQSVLGRFNRALPADWQNRVQDELLRDDILKCVSDDPAHRFASASELAQRLRRLGIRRTERAARDRIAHAAERRRIRRRNWAIGAGVFMILASTLVAVHSWLNRELVIEEVREVRYRLNSREPEYLRPWDFLIPGDHVNFTYQANAEHFFYAWMNYDDGQRWQGVISPPDKLPVSADSAVTIPIGHIEVPPVDKPYRKLHIAMVVVREELPVPFPIENYLRNESGHPIGRSVETIIIPTDGWQSIEAKLYVADLQICDPSRLGQVGEMTQQIGDIGRSH